MSTRWRPRLISPATSPAPCTSPATRLIYTASWRSTAGQAHIETNINADLTKSEPVWNLRAQLAKVDLRKLLKRKNPEELPAGLISATARADGTGISPASAKGGVDMRMTGFATAGMRLGDLSMAATVKNQVASLNLALAGPNGRARITGRVDIAKQPAYNLIISVEHLRPASLIRAAQIPRADLSLNATIDGSGYQPQTMRTRVRIGWLPSTVGGIRIDRGRVDANLAAGIVQIADASLSANDSTISAAGQFALKPQRQRPPLLQSCGRSGLGLARDSRTTGKWPG